MPPYALIALALVLADALILYVLHRLDVRDRRRDLQRELREEEYAIEREKDNPLRVVGGHAGPFIEQPEGRKRIGL